MGCGLPLPIANIKFLLLLKNGTRYRQYDNQQHKVVYELQIIKTTCYDLQGPSSMSFRVIEDGEVKSEKSLTVDIECILDISFKFCWEFKKHFEMLCRALRTVPVTAELLVIFILRLSRCVFFMEAFSNILSLEYSEALILYL